MALDRPARIFLLACLPALCLGFSTVVLFPVWSAMVSADTRIAIETLLSVASAESLATGLASVLYAAVGFRRPISSSLREGLVLILLANAVLAWALATGRDSFSVIIATRLVAGVGEGWTIAAALARIGRSRDADRIFVLNQLAIGLFAASMFGVLPRLSHFAAHYGQPSTAVFAALAILCCICLPLARLADRDDIKPVAQNAAPAAVGWRGGIAIVMVFCIFAGATQIYSSWGRIAAELSLPIEVLSGILGIGALAGMAALLVMIAVSRRIRPLVTIGFCLLLMSGAALISTHASLLPVSLWRGTLTLAVCVEQVASLAIAPLLLQVLASTDASGRTVSAAPMGTMVGSIVGPFVAAFVSRTLGLFAIGWTTIAFYALGLMLLGLLYFAGSRESSSATARASRA